MATQITDPDKIRERQLATAEKLHLIADAIAEGVFKDFSFTARENTKSTLVDARGAGMEGGIGSRTMTVSFVMREGAQLFFEDQKRRKEELDKMIEEIAQIGNDESAPAQLASPDWIDSVVRGDGSSEYTLSEMQERSKGGRDDGA